MSHLTLRQKLWVPLLFCWAALFIATIANGFEARHDQWLARQADLANVTDMAETIVASYARQAQAGSLSIDEAKKMAIAAVDVQRYGTSGYVTIVRSDSVVVNNPMSKAINGRNMIDFKDAKGEYLYRAIARTGASAGGAGYIRYWWPKPGAAQASEKLSFVKRFEPWGWDFVVGVYVDDIQAEFYRTLLRSSFMLLILGGLLSIVVSWVARDVAGSVGGEPSAAVAIAMRMAEGDLETRVDLKNDDRASLLFHLGEMRIRLSSTVSHIQKSTETIAIASKNIARGNLDLASRTEEQAASLQETAGSMAQLTTMVERNARDAHTATNLATDVSAIARQGAEVVGDLIGKMSVIHESVRKISEITDVIEAISFQTNILALNAAVEAARAGQEGRGFAVVAAEVRNLAQRSAAAAKEIAVLMDRSARQVNESSSLGRSSGEMMENVVRAIGDLKGVIDEIASASNEQSLGIAQVNVAIRQIDEVTHHTATLVEDAATASRSLDEQAEQLRVAMSVFRIGE